MVSTGLWILWVLIFGFLEYQGLEHADDSKFTLTNRIRALMRKSPLLRVIVRGAIALGLAWLAYHFLIVDPTLNPGA